MVSHNLNENHLTYKQKLFNFGEPSGSRKSNISISCQESEQMY